MSGKSRILYILKYLQEFTDEEHPVTLTDIMNHLKTLGIPSHRTTVKTDINQLIEFGVDIVMIRSTSNLYFIGQRALETVELKMLVDAVASSKFITQKKSEQLIQKIGGLTSCYHAEDLIKPTTAEKVVKPKNEQIYYSVDKIKRAIQNKQWVGFHYFEYTPQKERVHRNSGYLYEVCPYTTFWRDDHYYLIGHSKKHAQIAVFRIDRMDNPHTLDTKWLPPPENFDASVYANNVFEMWGGEAKTVELKCKNGLMDVIVDKFGEDVETRLLDENHFIAVAEVHISPRFYGWLFGFTGEIDLLHPADVKNEYVEIAQKIANKNKK